MDLSQTCTADQRQPPLLPSDSETQDSDCISQSFTADTLSTTDQPQKTLLSKLSQDLLLPQSETVSGFCTEQDQSLSQSYPQENKMPESTEVVSCPFEGLMDSFVSEASYTYENCQAASLLRPLSPQSESLESDTVGADSQSELYIFESGTQDFILSSMMEPQEINCPEYQSLTQTQTPHECDTNVRVCDSTDIVTQCHHGCSKDYEVEMDESGQRPPASDAWEEDLIMGNDERQSKTEVTGFYAQHRRSSSPIELWLDACQYLTGEDTDDRDVLEKTEHSVMERGLFATSDFSLLPGETQVSDFSPDGSEVIGWPDDDTRGWGPRVERWSSVDSWASALSDWTGIIEAAPNDFTAAFAEIGAEIDALTQALAEVNTTTDTETKEINVKDSTEQSAMGVQDQTLKEQNPPESSIHSSQSCSSFCLEVAPPETSDSESSQEESQNVPNYAPKCSSMGSSGAMVTLMSGSSCSSDLDLSDFDEYVTSERDIFTSSTEPIILNITEDTDLESSSRRLTKTPFEDGLCEVTDEHCVSQLDWSLGVSEENKSTTDPNFFTVHSVTSSHVPGVNALPGQHINVHAHLSFDTLPDFDGACQVGPQLGTPTFITPLAPLGIGSSLVGRTSCSLEDQTSAQRHLSDNTDLSCDCGASLISGENSGESSQGSDEDLIHKKEKISSTSEDSSQEGQVETHDAGKSVFTARRTLTEEINDFNRQLELKNLTAVPANHFFISKQSRVACITLHDPVSFRAAKPICIAVNQAEKMPHKTHKTTSENKTRTKKDKSTSNHHGAQTSKKQDSVSHHAPTQQTCKKLETHPVIGENLENTAVKLEAKEVKLVTEITVMTEKSTSKPHGKKKKKHATASGGNGSEPLIEVENGAKPKTAKGRIDMFEAKLGTKPTKETGNVEKKSQQVEIKVSKEEQASHPADLHPKGFTCPPNDEVIKRRRLSEDKFGKIVKALESKAPEASNKAKGEDLKVDVGVTRKKAYSEVVKQNIPVKEDLKVVQPIQAVSVSGDPQSLCLWCQFAAVFSEYTVTWSREGTVLAEIKRSAGDESRVSVTITNASHKDLGKYQCRLNGLHGSLTLDYLLTYEVLSEIVIPPSPTIISPPPVELPGEEEDVHYSKLMFNEDFLTDQYFGENKPISIITEKVHFGEGMHRRAFRTKLHGGQIPLLLPGHPCVLKVHNSISYGTKNNEELVQKNFALAVEECHVQNTARQYIKAYTAAAETVDAFGDVPEIIPIYLIHRLSNDIPYATLEEELIGDFVKYSVKDGKEINLMRRDSEAGQKCCAFQHWVYHKTEGNLLVTDMQGVGMRLTDVGIATAKKGYKGFKGNCATSFIDQFKALHQCNMYCELLGLKSLQAKPKKPAFVPKPKPQPSTATKKKTFGPTVKGKS